VADLVDEDRFSHHCYSQTDYGLLDFYNLLSCRRKEMEQAQ